MACHWLAWTGLARDPLRAALTTGRVAIAFVLLWFLKGVDSGMERLIASIPDDRLHVASRKASYVQLPLASLYVLDDVPGVSHVTPLAYHNTRYGADQDRVGLLAVSLERYLDVSF